MQRKGTARRAAVLNSSSLQRAVNSTLEQLENRQLFSVIPAIHVGTDGGGNKYLAWEAEENFTTVGTGTPWRFVSDPAASPAGGSGAAMGAEGGSTTTVATPGLSWNLKFAATDLGDYKLYVRRSQINAQNSMWVPAVTGGAAPAGDHGTLPSSPVATNTRSIFDNGALSASASDFQWSAIRDNNVAQSFIYTIGTDGIVNFQVNARENPGFVIDRLILSKQILSPNTVPADQATLNALANTAVSNEAPNKVTDLTGTPDGLVVHLKWGTPLGADKFFLERSFNGGAFTPMNGGNDYFENATDDNVAVPAGSGLGTYTYRITAKNDTGSSTTSTTNVVVDGRLQGPNGFKATGETATTVSLQWDGVPGADGYNLYRAELDPVTGLPTAAGFTKINGSTPLGVGQFDDTAATGLAPNGTKSYAYKVKVVNTVDGVAGEGPFGSQVISSTVGVPTGGVGWSAKYQDNNSNDANGRTGTPEYISIFKGLNRDGGTTADALNVTGGNDNIRFPSTPASFNTNSLPGNSFAASFEGTITAPSAGKWKLYSGSDDGIAITVDGVAQTVRNSGGTVVNYTDGRGIPALDDTITILNSAGQEVTWLAGSKHVVKVEFQQGGGGWDIRLRWAPDGDDTRKVNIPLAAVNPIVPTATTLSGGALDTKVELNWTQVDAVNYRIERSTDNFATAGTVIDTVPATAGTTSYSRQYTGLTNGTLYQFRVVAVNPTGEKASNTLAVTPGTSVPAAPVATAATGQFVDETHVGNVISYPYQSFINSYRVQRAEVDAAGNPITFADITTTAPGSGSSYIDTTAEIGKRYIYRVYATNAQGESLASANTAIVDITNGVHEYRYVNSDQWRSGLGTANGYKLVATNPDLNLFQRNVNSPRDIAENFSRLYTGKIHIAQEGDYTFAVNSDDNSFATVDGKLVANLIGWGRDAYLGGSGDGNQAGPTGNEVVLHLTPGDHDFQFWQQEGGGGDYADFKWKATDLTGTPDAGVAAPTGTLAIIPAGAFRNATGAPAAPTGVTATPDGLKANITFTDNATNETRFRVERSSSASGPWTALGGPIGLHDNTDSSPVAAATDSGLLPNTTYFYRVVAVNFAGETTSATTSVTTGTVPAVAGAQLYYYDNEWWQSPLQGTGGYQSPGTGGVEGSTLLSNIDFHQGDQNIAPPGAPAGDDGLNYSVVIVGKLKAAEAGSYRFVTQSDDDSYFVVNGKLVAQYPGGHGDDTGGLTVFPITLTEGQEVTYQYYMSEGGGGHGFHARWVTPNDPNAASYTTPASFVNAPLIPVYDSNAVPIAGGLTTNQEGVPDAPTAGTITNVKGTTATLNFTDNAANEVRYVLERSATADFATHSDTELPLVLAPASSTTGGAGGATSVSVSGLSPSTTYFFRLRAMNYDGASPYLNLGSVTTASLSNFVVTLQTDNKIKLDWTDSTPAGSTISIERAVDGGSFSVLTTKPSAAGAGTYTDAATLPGHSYKYRIQATNIPPGNTSSVYLDGNFAPTTYHREAGRLRRRLHRPDGGRRGWHAQRGLHRPEHAAQPERQRRGGRGRRLAEERRAERRHQQPEPAPADVAQQQRGVDRLDGEQGADRRPLGHGVRLQDRRRHRGGRARGRVHVRLPEQLQHLRRWRRWCGRLDRHRRQRRGRLVRHLAQRQQHGVLPR